MLLITKTSDKILVICVFLGIELGAIVYTKLSVCLVQMYLRGLLCAAICAGDLYVIRKQRIGSMSPGNINCMYLIFLNF